MSDKTNQNPIAKENQKNALYPYRHFIGGAVGGMIDAAFHPLDTAATRVQLSKHNLNFNYSFRTILRQLSQVIYQETYHQSWSRKVSSLYRGLPFALAFKMMRATYKFGTQPLAVNQLDQIMGKELKNKVGEKKGAVLLELVAGFLTASTGDTAFLFLDNLKTKCQNVKQKNIWQLVKEEKFNLYNGWQLAMLRNGVGTGCFFGTSTMIKKYVFDEQKITFQSNLISSLGAATATIVTINPIDILKTRIQAERGKSPGSFSTTYQMIKNEGVFSLWKGTFFRLAAGVPRMALMGAVAQTLPKLWSAPEPANEKEMIRRSPK